METGKLQFTVEFDERGGIRLRDLNGQLVEFGDKAKKAGDKGQSAFSGFGAKIVALNQALDLGRRGFDILNKTIGKVVETGANFETLRMQLDTVFGSAAAGQKSFDWLLKFAAKSPFQMEGLTKATIILKNFGVDAQAVMGTMADTASSMSLNIEDVAALMGKIFNKPKASMEEINQLAERGIPVMEILQKQLGLTKGQIAEIGSTGISGAQVFNALMTGLGEKFQGASERMSRSWKGLMSTFQDTFDMFLDRIAKGGLLDALKSKLTGIIEKFDKWAADGTLERVAKQIADAMISVVNAIIDIAKFIWEWRGALLSFAKIWASVWAGEKLAALLNWGSAMIARFRTMGAAAASVKLGTAAGLASAAQGAPVAAMVGWEIGTFINDELKLGDAIQRASDSSQEFSDRWSQLSTGVRIEGIAERIRGLGKAVGVTSGSMKEIAVAAFKNKVVFNQLDEATQAHIARLAGVVAAEKTLNAQQGANVEALRRNAAAALYVGQVYGAMSGTIGAAGFAIQALAGAMPSATSAAFDTGEAAKKAADDLQKMAESMGLLTKVGLRQLETDAKNFVASYKAGFEQIKNSPDVLEKTKKIADEMAKSFAQAGKEIPPALSKIKSELESLAVVQNTANVVYINSETAISDYLEMLDGGPAVVSGMAKAMDVLISKQREIAIAFAQGWAGGGPLGVGGGVLGMYSAMGYDVGKGMDRAADSTKKFGVNFKDTNEVVEFGKTIMAGFTDILSAMGVEMGETGKNLLGLATGVGTLIQGISTGNVGSIIQGAVQAIGSLFKLFQGDGIGEAIKRENEFMGLTDAQTKKLKELAKEYGDVHAATSTLLGEYIKTADITGANFDTWAARMNEINLDLERGKLSGQEWGDAMGSAWSALVDKMTTLKMPGISRDMVTTLEHIRADGREMPAEIQAFISGELQKGVSAWSDYVDKATGSQDDFNRAVKFGAAFFATAVAEGQSLAEIMDSMGPGFDKMVAAMKEKGYSGGALQSIIDLRKTMTDNQDVVDAIATSTKMLEALGNTAYLTADIFKEFQGDAVSQFNKLVASTKNEKQSLQIMAPELAKIAWYSKQYGFALDSQTQSLIDKAKAEGINLENMKTMEQLQTDQNGLMRELVDIFKQYFGILDKTSDKIVELGARGKKIRDDLGEGGGIDGGLNGGGRKIDVTAATGYSGVVYRPTVFLAGEAGPERVTIRPGTDGGSGGNITVSIHPQITIMGATAGAGRAAAMEFVKWLDDDVGGIRDRIARIQPRRA